MRFLKSKIFGYLIFLIIFGIVVKSFGLVSVVGIIVVFSILMVAAGTIVILMRKIRQSMLHRGKSSN